MEEHIPKEHFKQFAIKSNILSDILNDAADDIHTNALIKLLTLNKLNFNSLIDFVKAIEPASDSRKEQTIIGCYKLANVSDTNTLTMFLLKKINTGELVNPWTIHMELLHIRPFTDANSRLARALWLWVMVKYHNYKFEDTFGRLFYQQTFVRYLGLNSVMQ